MNITSTPLMAIRIGFPKPVCMFLFHFLVFPEIYYSKFPYQTSVLHHHSNGNQIEPLTFWQTFAKLRGFVES